MDSPIYKAAALHEAGHYAEAEKIYRALLAENPDDANALHLLGVLATQANQLDDAEAMIRRAIALMPDFPTAWNNLGYLYIRRNRHAEAMAFLQRAIDLQPKHPEAFVNRGTCYRALNRNAEALAALETAIRYDPYHAGAHWNLALVLLSLGDYSRGFAEYEWRWKWRDFPSRRWNYTQPQWDGSPLNGRRILLHAEQGLGDSIQCVRYVPMVQAMGGRVIVKAEKELHTLLATVGGIERLVGIDEGGGEFDVHLPMMSLPRAFGTTVGSIPAKVPYLSADPGRVKYWRSRLADGSGRLNVGVCWAGKTVHRNDVNRSLPPELLEPLAGIPGMRYVSLQKEARARPPASLGLVDFTAELTDFADTAALMSALDLILTVDTSIAHLAGALAKSVWTLLPFAPDWRWLLGGERTPWYPTMRLFRQPAIAFWPPVLAEIAATLKKGE